MAVVEQLCLSADPALVQHHVRRVLDALPVRWRLETTQLGLVEAISNAIYHGALGLGSRGDVVSFLDLLADAAKGTAGAKRRCIRVFVSCREDVVRVRVRDPGNGFDWRRTRARPGRGLWLINAAFRRVRWSRRGNAVELTLRGQEVDPWK